MKKFLLLYLFTIVTFNLFYCQIQAPDMFREDSSTNESSYELLNNVIVNLDLSEISTHILLDKAFQLVPYEKFDNGITQTVPEVTYSEWKRLYGTILSGSIVGQFVLPDPKRSISPFEQKAKNNSTIPVGLINMKYHRTIDGINNDSTYFTSNGGQLFDVPGRQSSPYTDGQVFATSLLREVTQDSICNFVLVPDLIFDNTSESLVSFSMDFDDGRGFVDMIPGAETPVLFNKVGLHIFKVKAVYSNGDIKENFIKFNVKRHSIQKRYENNADYILVVPPTSLHSGATVSIAYGCGDLKLRKPFIVIEGFDPDALDNAYQLHYSDFYNQLSNYPSLDLENELELGGYDLVYIDFNDGSDDIFRNSKLVQEVIMQLNSIKQSNGSVEENVVMGMSMGGLVAKHSLRSLELANQNHQTRKLITFDTPHNGANVPLGYQSALFELASVNVTPFVSMISLVPEMQIGIDVATSEAAQQMLIYQFDYTGQVNRFSFQSDIDNIGFPQNGVELVAISNGSETTENQGYGFNAQLVDISTSHYLFIPWWVDAISYNFGTNTFASIEIYALPNNPSNYTKIYGHFIFASVLFIPVTLSAVNQKIKNNPPYDNAPGGNYDYAEYGGIDITADVNTKPGVYVNPSSTNFCFVPSVSGLDLSFPYSNDLFYNIASNNIINTNKTVFNSYSAVNNTQVPSIDNEDHISFSVNNDDFFLNSVVDFDQQINIPFSTTNIGPANPYNFGKGINYSTTNVLLKNVNILSGGELCSNCNQSIAYQSSNFNNPIVASEFDLFVKGNNCNVSNLKVTINDNAVFKIGDNSSGNKSNVYFENNTELRISAGGKLQIADNSKLIIEKGSKLTFAEDAEIELLGDNAVLEIRGEIYIEDNAIFTFTYPGSNSGYVKFNVPFNPCTSNPNWACPVIHGGLNSQIIFDGVNRNDKILEITDGDMLIPEEIELFRIITGKAEFKTSDSRLSLGSNRYQLLGSDFEGVGGRGISVYGNPTSSISSCNFDNVRVFGQLFYGGNQLNITSSTFNNGAHVKTYGAGGRLINVDFNNSINGGWYGEGAILPQLYSLGNLNEVAFGVDNYPSNTSLLVRYVNISDFNSFGIVQTGGSLDIRCSNITNNNFKTGVGVYGHGQLNMSSIDGNGYNKINNCSSVIDFWELDLLNINAGYNDFRGGTFRGGLTYYCGGGSLSYPNTITGHGNKWFTNNTQDPNIFPSSTFPKVKITTSDNAPPSPCPITLEWSKQPSPFPTLCGELDNNGGGSSSGVEDHPLKSCSTCGNIYSQHFNGVRLDSAILFAVSNMEKYDSTKNDLQAITLFSEIFNNTTFDLTDPNQLWLQTYAYEKMKFSLQNCFVSGKISKNDNIITFHQCVNDYNSVIQLLKQPISQSNAADQFYLALDEALMYQLIGKTDNSVQLLENIDQCYLTEFDRKILDYWKTLTDLENQIIKGIISRESAESYLVKLEELKPIRQTAAGSISSTANIDSSVSIGTNVVIGDNVSVDKDVQIGNNVVIDNNIAIGENTIIGNNVKIGTGTMISKDVLIGNNIEIGSNVTLDKNVQLEDNVNIQNNVQLFKDIHIGDFVKIGENTEIDKNTTISAGTYIGSNVNLSKDGLIGANVIIRKGVVLNKNFIIGDIVLIGSNANIHKDLRIGTGSIVNNDVVIGKTVSVCDNIIIENNIGNNTVLGNFSYPSPPTQVGDETFDKEFALNYAKNQTNFLNGFSMNVLSVIAGENITFTPSSLGKNYSWDFGGIYQSSGKTPSIQFRREGIYSVVLTISDDCSTITKTGAVTVLPNPRTKLEIAIPDCISSENIIIKNKLEIDETYLLPSVSSDYRLINPDYLVVSKHLTLGDGMVVVDSANFDQIINIEDTSYHIYANPGNYTCKFESQLSYVERTTLDKINTTHYCKSEKVVEAENSLGAQLLSVIEDCSQDSYSLAAYVSGGSGSYEYNWEFNNGINLTGQTVSIAISSAATSVNISVTDNDGCIDYLNIPLNMGNCSTQIQQNGIGQHNSEVSEVELSNQSVSIQTNVIESLQVYPNPAKGEINFVFNELRPMELTIYNLSGQVLRKINLGSETHRTVVNLSDCNNGLYFFSLKMVNDQILNGKILLEK